MCSMKHALLFLTISVVLFGCAAQTRVTEAPADAEPQQARVGQGNEESKLADEQLTADQAATALSEDALKVQGRPVETASSDEINVNISIRPEFQSDGHVVICGETNLPRGTALLISLRQQGTPGCYQSKCSVADGGRFRSESLGPRSVPLVEGSYVADVVMPITRLQPAEVRQVVGENGEKLTGPLIVRDALGVSARSYDTSFPVKGTSAISLQGQSEEHPPVIDRSTPLGKWYQGGTLHRKTALDWQNASSANKLATCADFVAGMWDKGKLKPSITRTISAVDDFRPYAQQLVGCLDAAFKPWPDPEENRRLFANQTVASFAAMGMVTMGWMK
jgi:hypothetical protein